MRLLAAVATAATWAVLGCGGGELTVELPEAVELSQPMVAAFNRTFEGGDDDGATLVVTTEPLYCEYLQAAAEDAPQLLADYQSALDSATTPAESCSAYENYLLALGERFQWRSTGTASLGLVFDGVGEDSASDGWLLEFSAEVYSQAASELDCSDMGAFDEQAVLQLASEVRLSATGDLLAGPGEGSVDVRGELWDWQEAGTSASRGDIRIHGPIADCVVALDTPPTLFGW